MPQKLLQYIVTVEQPKIQQTLIRSQQLELVNRVRETVEETYIMKPAERQYRFLNVKFLLMAYRLSILLTVYPELAYKEVPSEEEIETWRPYEEEDILRRRYGTLAERYFIRRRRRVLFRLLREIEERIELLDYPQNLHKVMQRVLSSIEGTFETIRKELFDKLIDTYMDMVEFKSWRFRLYPELRHIQRVYADLYLAYKTIPGYNVNFYGLRLTAKTLSRLIGRIASIYSVAPIQKEKLKAKALLKPVERRHIKTKAVLSGKGAVEEVTSKLDMGIVTDTHPYSTVNVGVDYSGKEIMWLILLYATGIPYWAKLAYAMREGYPENRKFYRDPRVYYAPDRRTRGLLYRHRYGDASWLMYRREEYLKELRRTRGYFRIGYSIYPRKWFRLRRRR